MFITKKATLHISHQIGQHFMCATQMYNHIPGHGALARKNSIADNIISYAKKYANNPKCFDKNQFFPTTYRLYDREECLEFFKILLSNKYEEKIKTEPIQYIVKNGHSAHQGLGVSLLDANKTTELNKEYKKELLCGQINNSLLVQDYIKNSLLFDHNKKLDFRIYLLIASTNPIIAFYHDGFIRVALGTYDKNSTDQSVHLTHPKFGQKIIDEAKKKGNVSEEELRDSQARSLEDLQEYLLEIGKINDRTWLDNHLRRSFKKAFVHLVRMIENHLWKGSNVFEMYGVDFMIDENLNVWFIEANLSPQMIATNTFKRNLLYNMIKDLIEIQFAYYRSRMKRLYSLLNAMGEEKAIKGDRKSVV